MSKSWAWLILCLSSIVCAQSIVIPASPCVWRAGDDPAQNSKGELFGFDRISQLLRGGTDGAALAMAAQQFGQEDDITVLTLTFAPAEVLHA